MCGNRRGYNPARWRVDQADRWCRIAQTGGKTGDAPANRQAGLARKWSLTFP